MTRPPFGVGYGDVGYPAPPMPGYVLFIFYFVIYIFFIITISFNILLLEWEYQEERWEET